ncbi:GntR family transcriptional regulator [Amnibacterium endophyticum]|uniref:GntR family transcriptional regulator n=1 Tax=Amnibacterium endophyticum TaxID=2109337 RepID=A0ABW4LH28_9MICO
MIALDQSDPTPPFEQIRAQLHAAIRAGTLPSGARLPAIRQLAGDLRVAPGTVARAYRQLETDGLVTSNRSHGTTVAADNAVSDSTTDAAKAFTTTVAANGTSLDDALAAVRATWPPTRTS